MPFEPPLLALVLALPLSVLLTRLVLSQARRRQVCQNVRDDGPQTHLVKQGTPSGGGVAILVATVVATLVAGAVHPPGWLQQPRLLLVLGLGLAYGAVGLVDDLSKLRGGNTRGLKARYRLAVEIVLAVAFAVGVGLLLPYSGVNAGGTAGAGWGFGGLTGSASPLLHVVWVALGALVVVAAGNAVNLTDGVDGLAATLVALCAAALGLGCAWAGQADLALLAWAISGAAAGFLWFNAHPAKLFMGDVGALGLGGLLGGLAVAAGLEGFFALVAVVFIADTLSVIVQVAWFKRTGRRVFRMTPIHHAFELKGWSEPQVVARFALLGLLAAALALSLLMRA